MSDAKKDLTRIEDLGEFIHEITEETPEEESPPDFPGEETHFEESSSSETDQSTNFSDSSFSSDSSSENSETLDFSNSESTTLSEESNFAEDEKSFEEVNSGDSEIFSEENTGAETNFGIEESSQDSSSLSLKEDFEVSSEESVIDETILSPTLSEFEEKEEETPTPLAAPEIKKSLRDQNEISTSLLNEKNNSTFSMPENFSDVKKFAESSNLTGIAAEGNPSFSVLISEIKFIEDIEDIIRLLKELGLLGDEIEQARKRLQRGSFLVPRISEYAAIYLAHKLRRFDIDIKLGLSDDIHPPKHGEKPETGIVTKSSLFQNQNHQFNFNHPKVELSQILISTTANLEGYQIQRYLGVATEHQLIDGYLIEEEETTKDVPKAYHEIALKLKAHALQLNANAIVGITYQLTPIPVDLKSSISKYRLTCSGNLVWVNKI